jgi:hypothetical protein
LKLESASLKLESASFKLESASLKLESASLELESAQLELESAFPKQKPAWTGGEERPACAPNAASPEEVRDLVAA